MPTESTHGLASADWLAQLRNIHEESLDRDWERLATAINEQLGLTGTAALRPSINGLPPIWFQGDVERIQPGKWVLVMSLNHQLPTAWEYATVTRESAWHMQCDHHRDHWYKDFFGPLTRVAAVAMGLTGDAVDFKSYASQHLVH